MPGEEVLPGRAHRCRCVLIAPEHLLDHPLIGPEIVGPGLERPNLDRVVDVAISGSHEAPLIVAAR